MRRVRVNFFPVPLQSRGIARAEIALRQFAPAEVEFVNSWRVADLSIIHVIGYPETVKTVSGLAASGKRYAMIQYCFKSTQKPDMQDWLSMWENSALTWSYYDLDLDAAGPAAGPRPDWFFYSPLGVDSDLFRCYATYGRTYLIATSGYVAESETVDCVHDAVSALQGRMFHLGPNLFPDSRHVRHERDIGDFTLSHFYSSSRYVSGLRRCEGFELPVIEGAMCGARPICYDRPHYRAWFEDLPVYIPERPVSCKADTVNDLLSVLSGYDRGPVTAPEREWVRDRFDWRRIAHGFWGAALARLE